MRKCLFRKIRSIPYLFQKNLFYNSSAISNPTISSVVKVSSNPEIRRGSEEVGAYAPRKSNPKLPGTLEVNLPTPSMLSKTESKLQSGSLKLRAVGWETPKIRRPRTY